MSVMRGRRRALVRTGVVGAAVVAAMSVAAGTAWAHLEPVPGAVTKGEIADVTFRVPNERDDASTVAVRLTLPADHPVAVAKVRATPGWQAVVAKEKLPKPVKTGNVTVTEAYTTITWTALPGTRIGPGESAYGEFGVNLGPLPTDVDTFVITAAQTYDNGEVVNWDQLPGKDGEEPNNPAPVLNLTSAATGAPAAAPANDTANDTATWLGGAALVVAALALGVATGALLRGRRTPTSSSTKDTD